jgi:hypothetical protein
MLDPAQNPAAISVAEGLMPATANTFTGYVGPLSRVLEFAGGNRLLDVSVLRRLFGNGLTHYYRLGVSGDVGTFVLQLGTAGVE